MAYFMENMTVQDMKEALEKTKTVILPVGVVEQHGYHLPLSTDMYIATEIPKRAGDRLNAVVAPVLSYCYSGGELPGTVNISPQLFGLLITDICAEFARIGFDNIVVFLGHGGPDNTVALKTSLQMILKRNPHLRDKTFSLVEAWNLSATCLECIQAGPEHDFHAGQVETSLMLYWKPELVKDKIVMDEPAVARMLRTDPSWFELSEKSIDHPFIIPTVTQREEVKIGVMGFPEKASRELGEKISRESSQALIEYIDMLNEKTKG